MSGIWKPQRGSPIIPGHPLAPRYCWLINEGAAGTVYDIGGTNKHGTLTAGYEAYWEGSENGWKLNAAGDASGRYISMGAAGILSLLTQFTVVAAGIFQDSGLDRTYSLWSEDRVTSGARVYSIGHEPDLNNFVFAMYSAGTTYTVADTASYSEGFHVLAGTLGPGGMHLYVDGIDKSIGDTTRTANTSYGTVSPFIGLDHVNNHTGMIDPVYVWIYPRELFADEVAQLYADPYCFIDQGEMDWLTMRGAGAPPGVFTEYYYRRRRAG